MPASDTQALDVVGLGSCVWDYLGILDQMPEFDALTVSLSDFAMSGGGPVSTALVALARLGARTGYIGAIGDDEPGVKIKHAYEQEGIDIRRLRVQPGARSPVCMVLVQNHTGRRSIVCHRGSFREVELDAKDRAYVTAARFLHLDGHHTAAAISAARWAREAGATVVFDANRTRPRLDELLPWVDVLITNASFPSAYTGEQDLDKAARHFMCMGIKLVVTTLSEEGCVVYASEATWHAPGFAVPVVDTTGAGDAFHGAFIYGLLRDWDLRRTATFANAVAALNCTALGGRAGLPSLAQVEEFLKQRNQVSARLKPGS
jgi:sulfofructose kinase